MIARDVDAHLHQVGTWVDWDDTSTDVFKAGDPERTVGKIAVAWKANWPALREAHEQGAALFISHESICVHVLNGDQEPEENSPCRRSRRSSSGFAKRNWSSTDAMISGTTIRMKASAGTGSGCCKSATISSPTTTPT